MGLTETERLRQAETKPDSWRNLSAQYPKNHRIRLLFFIGTLRSGGKERRCIELLRYLKEQGSYDLHLVLAYDVIQYDSFYKLKIPYTILGKKTRNDKDLTLFLKVARVVSWFRPDIIHTWGAMQTFYALPAARLRRIPLVNGQVTNAKPPGKPWSFSSLINRVNFRLSDALPANSHAGLKAWSLEQHKKARVIYNGMDLSRFEHLPDPGQVKQKYRIQTPLAVVMVASFTRNKDHSLFYKIAKRITAVREDITCIAAGGPGKTPVYYEWFYDSAKNHPRILCPGQIPDAEALIHACDIGVLFTNTKLHGEGISNSIIEYMALGKPVVATDNGGTGEIVLHNENGYLVGDESPETIAGRILELLDNPEKRRAMGERGRQIIQDRFRLDLMGRQFESLYSELLD